MGTSIKDLFGTNLTQSIGLAQDIGLATGIPTVEFEEKTTTPENEEWVWVDGYKGTESDMKCRDQQYEIGKTYVMPEDANIKACESGFHFCLGLADVFHYYVVGNGRRFFKVRGLVRKSDLDKMAEPITEWTRGMGGLFYIPTMSWSIDPKTGMPVCNTDKTEDKLAAKSIEFVSELTIEEIFEKTYGKDWSEEDKKLALERGMSYVDDLITERERKIKQREQVETLVGLGYSMPFAEYIVKCAEKYDEAYAVGTQSDLSMDMKVLAIMNL